MTGQEGAAVPEASLQASIPAEFGDRVELHCDSPELIGLQLHVHDASLWVLLDPKQATQVAAHLLRLASSDPAPTRLARNGLEQLLADVQAAQARVEATRHLHRNQASGILGAFAGAIRDVLSGALPVLAELDGPQ